MIAAGQALLEEHGVIEQVVLSDVIRLAGTSTGAFYGRFKDKDAFIKAVLENAFVGLRAQADEVVNAERATGVERPPREVAALIVKHYVEMCRSNQGMFRACLRYFTTRNTYEQPMRTLNRHTQDLFVPMLAGRIQRPGKSTQQIETDVRIAMQMMVGTLTLMLVNNPGPLRLEDKDTAQRLTELMTRFLELP